MSGSILILSLWVLTFLSLVAASLSFRMGMAFQIAQHPWKQMQLEQLAKGAVVAGAKDYVAPEGSWTVYGMEDESGKINLNASPAEDLERLFGARADVVPAILDWRDPRPGKRPGGANDCDYVDFGYACRNGAFRSLEELLLVKGMTPELFQDVRESLTVYTSGPVNINTASERVLQALGLPTSLVRKIILFREGPDGIRGTQDDVVFPSPGTVVALLEGKSALSDPEKQILSKRLSQTRLDVQADSFRLKVVTRLGDRRASGRFSIVMSAQGKPERFLCWRENRS